MDLNNAKELARSEMNRRGLQDWDLDMSYVMKTTFGSCNIKKKLISLSALLVSLNNEEQILDTINHEIAHALREIERGNIGELCRHYTGSQWHDYRWQQIAASLGATPTRYYNGPQAEAYGKAPVVMGQRVSVKPPWRMTCPNCGTTGTTIRKKNKRSVCAKCVRTTGKYFYWVYTKNV